jgi:homoserine dehydrogenase
MVPRVGIIGVGGIGQTLKKRIKEESWTLAWMAGNSKKRWSSPSPVDVVFVAISTLDMGEAARDYILRFVKKGIPVVTCEKGSWAYHPEALTPHRKLIGYQAACGGGTELLRKLSTEVLTEGVMIDSVINATLQHLFSPIQGRVMPRARLYEAQRLRLVEPGPGGLMRTIQGEVKDATLKACVLFNTTLSCGEGITPQQFSRREFIRSDLERMRKDNFQYRFTVSFTNRACGFGDQVWPGEFRAQCGDWKVKGGFGLTEEDGFWIPDGPMNGYRIVGSPHHKATDVYVGPGAGRAPTVGAMMNDAKRLLRI